MPPFQGFVIATLLPQVSVPLQPVLLHFGASPLLQTGIQKTCQKWIKKWGKVFATGIILKG